jgi:hypothetical protein
MSTTKLEVEITFEQKEVAKRFQRLTLTFSTMPDLDMSLPTPPDIGLHPERKMSIKNWK